MPGRKTGLREVRLRPGRDKSLKARHPWVFSGAIADVEGQPEAGESVRIINAEGLPLAIAAYSPLSQIRCRAWSFSPEARVDADWFQAHIAAALARRAAAAANAGIRLIHAESDGLAGLIVDRYADTLVFQLLSAGSERWRREIADALVAVPGIRAVYERSDADVRRLEGLSPRVGTVCGSVPDAIEIVEHGIAYRVDVMRGHKTGFYLDQRDNRARVGALAQGAEVLNAFCYTGGFSLAALRGGAQHVLSIDSSGEALQLARHNAALNGLDSPRSEWREADVFVELRALRQRGAQFDLIILDPPKFAPTERLVARAARAYKDINLLAMKLLRPGGLLATFSCSGAVSADLFRKIVAGAAIDAAADFTLLSTLGAAEDHPVLMTFPEGEYLKGLLLRKTAP